MFYHSIKLAFRNFLRYKSSFFINLIGLSTGLACAFLIYMWVNDERSYDQFHEKGDHLYQVMTNHGNDAGMETWRWSPAHLGEAMETEFPEVERTVSASGIFQDFVVSTDQLKVKANAHFVDNQYFITFSFPVLEGNTTQLLPDKNSAAISKSMALKLFNTTENIVGKTFSWEGMYGNTNQAVITGLFEDVPKGSSQQFDLALSYDLYTEIRGEGANWGNFDAITYTLLSPKASLQDFNKKAKSYLVSKRPEGNADMFLKKYSELYLYNKFENGVQAGGRITYVRLFSIIALFILLIACINFMNLSTARGTVRLKEVGVKKTLGADRSMLIFQYLGESILLTSLALIIALLLVWQLLPQFNQITDKQLALQFSFPLILTCISITLLTGILAGSYPAFYLSGFKPVDILKGKIQNSFGEIWARKGLVIFQFSLSLILIASVTVVYQQMQFIQSKNLGYNKDQVLYFNLEGKARGNIDALTEEVKQLPGVVNASSMWGSFVGMTGSTGGEFSWEGRNPEGNLRFNHFGVNPGTLELLDVEMTEGRTFSKNFGEESSKIIINEAGIKAMGLENPVGKTFGLWGKDYEIIGIAKNFHFESLHNAITPFFIRLAEDDAGRMLVKIEQGKEQETIAALQSFYKEFNPGFDFNYHFMDEDYQQMYTSESRVATLSRYFAGIAIIISCLGLFGLAAFTASRKRKEIGIRKVLGASVSNIVLLLTKEFTQPVLASIFIGLPIAYLIAKKWLDGFNYHIDLSWSFLVLAAGLVLMIAWLTVGSQAIKSALINPKDAIKEE